MAQKISVAYIKDITKYEPMSAEEEQAAFLLYKENHDRLLKQKLMNSNMRFVLKIALEFNNAKCDLTDLISEGAMGLSRAVEEYDVTRGTKFITLAVYWIKAYINSSLNKYQNVIHIPYNVISKYNKEKRKATKLGQTVEVDEKLMKAMGINNSQVSIDAKMSDDAHNTYADVIADENTDDFDAVEATKSVVRGLTQCLPELEREVIDKIYGFSTGETQTLREVGAQIGYSHVRVRQLRDQALRRIVKYTSPVLLEEAKEIVYA